MKSKPEFDSEFCDVRYIEDDNVVLLSWRKPARGDDYRRPTLFALDLLRQHRQSNFIVDARNGFEDDGEDVEWGFSELLPNMAKTDCRYVAFIVGKAVTIEDEMDMWAKEFGKYFTVIKVESYEQALFKMKDRILVNVRYTIRPGKRDEFLEKVNGQGIVKGSRAEAGNLEYEYHRPVDSEDDLFLMEIWVSGEAQAVHARTEHYEKLQALKREYVTAVAIEKYRASAIS